MAEHHKFSQRSRQALLEVHPALVSVVELALKKTEQDFMVVEGVRSPERQRQLYAQGRTAPGPKVTWTLNSNHFKKSDGYGHAVDLVPYPVDWDDIDKFKAISLAMFDAAQELCVKIEWGGNWKKNKDYPHFEYKGTC